MDIRKWVFLAFSLVTLFGCQSNDNAARDDDQSTNRFMQVENRNETENTQLTNTEIAEHLADVASNVPEVNEASAVVAGPYTIVAIDVNEDIDRSRVGTIKYTVSEALYHDPWGKTAVVVADADLMARVRGMGDQIQAGYPVQGIVEELAAIVGRAIPEFPIMDDVPIEQDDNKEMLDENDKNELEKIEDEQSRHRKE
ncbi:YhcN/YlaJ family sporulation lipoprotein [Oceanobacillus alkalisoli]|uniref:YhcN/YlaJ family sporulation lipoprotein n=1 Tax=Oceanobacillus alkalisoli TaxID=2925113 RepID=UPI001EF13209|nr:YhcN/YlaJ family sporulation lipoprotein [Oceanobacillus alkalisoli]MCF3942556.1 YhcN/YlaJ family sporulation lipoprotein [Oceanobacillus alkalisoli]MCG5103613.1 YhcN/YlaJ family sporulation lipoprotein [Oceanobacillus alkalisoli]